MFKRKSEFIHMGETIIRRNELLCVIKEHGTTRMLLFTAQAGQIILNYPKIADRDEMFQNLSDALGNN